ncbi:hypothetical protein [uncultured Eubacterium sp.]|uniref:hypothetical protein n=1 Tax=uncultured Eubacterium sp. TaxID=165185 RepID=UPI002592893B|nr:hypothetical protein [uncultured Eubacterium sp.]
MLNIEDIEEIIEKVKESIEEKIILANRTGDLDKLLNSLDLGYLLNNNSVYETEKDGKIVLVGQSEAKLNTLEGIIKSLGLDKNRFEFYLDYNDGKTFNYKKMQYSPNYRVVLFGPVPHSSVGKNDSSSVITEMKNKEGYPRVVTLNDGNELKITKTNFRLALEHLIKEDYI